MLLPCCYASILFVVAVTAFKPFTHARIGELPEWFRVLGIFNMPGTVILFSSFSMLSVLIHQSHANMPHELSKSVACQEIIQDARKSVHRISVGYALGSGACLFDSGWRSRSRGQPACLIQEDGIGVEQCGRFWQMVTALVAVLKCGAVGYCLCPCIP